MQQCQGNATPLQGTGEGHTSKEDAGSQQDLIPGTPTNLVLGTRCGPDVPAWGPSSCPRCPTLLVDLAARVCVQGCHLSPAGVSALSWCALVPQLWHWEVLTQPALRPDTKSTAAAAPPRLINESCLLVSYLGWHGALSWCCLLASSRWAPQPELTHTRPPPTWMLPPQSPFQGKPLLPAMLRAVKSPLSLLFSILQG